MSYATVEELDAALGYTPNGAQRLLDRASRDIRRATKCAVYEVDDDDVPTDPVVLAAMKAACLEQVAYQLEVGNTSGIRHNMQPGVPSGTSAGSVDLSRGQSVGGNTERLPRIGEQVWSILQAAQLVPQGPIPV
jgi:hypothetical protein